MTDASEQFVLLTGSDTGDRELHLSDAARLISERVGTVIRSSSILETEPWGFSSDTLFLNQALLIGSTLKPLDLLRAIQGIETDMGRIRQARQWSSRTIDIDILCTEHHIHHCNVLSVPHRHLHRRAFALGPLCELVPDWNHQLLNVSYRKLLHNLTLEDSKVKAVC